VTESMTQAPDLFLASRSPRRRELLTQIGIQYELIDVEVDETPTPGELPAEYVTRLAIAKSRRGYEVAGAKHGSLSIPVLGSDTTVTIDDRVLGKPRDHAHAREMLTMLSGREHHVLTAIALTTSNGQTHSRLSRTSVTFREIGPDEIDAYWATGEPADKAGAYAIQGRGIIFVSAMSGSYSGVVGLPLHELDRLLVGLSSE